jgi:ABC-2 type transport system permease protein
MPIYEQTYREYDGQLRPHFRWWIIIQQELRVLMKSRFFKLIMLAALLHILARVLIITLYDTVTQDPNNPLAEIFNQFSEFSVDSSMFYDFIRIQGPMVFVLLIFTGSGMIGNDFNNNLMEIYFSKPITWVDYAMGKIGTLVLLGLGITAIPGILLVVLHNLQLPGMDTIKASWWWPLAILGYSLAIVLPCVLGVLASSSLIRSKNFAAVAIFMVLIANSAMGLILGQVLKNNNYRIVSFPMAVTRIGQQCFKEGRLMFELRWEWSLLYVAFVCLIAAAIIFRTVRRAEIAQ